MGRFLSRVFSDDVLAASAGAEEVLEEVDRFRVHCQNVPSVVHKIVRVLFRVDGAAVDEHEILDSWSILIKVKGTVVAAFPTSYADPIMPQDASQQAGASTVEHYASRGPGVLAGLPIPSEEGSITVSMIPTGSETDANSAPANDVTCTVVLLLVEGSA